MHNGHMEVLRKCAEESEHLVVGIGSAQTSHDPDNPFTAGERYIMISRSLREAGITDFSIVPVEDLNRYSVWVAHVVSMVPPFGRVYTNNPMTRRLFEEAGYEVRRSPLYNREVYSGTEVRRRMVAGEDWRSLVPGPVADIIDGIDGVGRVRDITGGSDGAPLRGRPPRFHSERQRRDDVLRRVMHWRTHRRCCNRCSGNLGVLHGVRCDIQQRGQDGRSRCFRGHSDRQWSGQ